MITCIHHYGIIESSFTALKSLCVPVFTLPPPPWRLSSKGRHQRSSDFGRSILKNGMTRGSRREVTALVTGHPSNPGMKWLTPLELPVYFTRRYWTWLTFPSLPLSFSLLFHIARILLKVHLHSHTLKVILFSTTVHSFPLMKTGVTDVLEDSIQLMTWLKMRTCEQGWQPRETTISRQPPHPHFLT